MPPIKKAKTMEEINIHIQKLERRCIREQQKRIKPGECLKYIKLIVDPEVVSILSGGDLLGSFLSLDMKYEVLPNKLPRTFYWERLHQQTFDTKDSKATLSEKYQREDQSLYLMCGKEFIDSIRDNSIPTLIQNVKDHFEGCHITFLILGIKSYCKKNKVLSRIEIETQLAEFQILHDCNVHLLETASDVVAFIVHFHKAVAEGPYKKQQNEKTTDGNIFLLNDNKDCVRVEGTAGLARLWQQHLTRLPLVTLETAEAIISEYPNPKKLLDEYKTSPNGPQMLSDFKIQRAKGPLKNDRRIGPELSRKIYTLYNSLDPNTIL